MLVVLLVVFPFIFVRRRCHEETHWALSLPKLPMMFPIRFQTIKIQYIFFVLSWHHKYCSMIFEPHSLDSVRRTRLFRIACLESVPITHTNTPDTYRRNELLHLSSTKTEHIIRQGNRRRSSSLTKHSAHLNAPPMIFIPYTTFSFVETG